MPTNTELRDQIYDQGFANVPGVMPPVLLERLRTYTNNLLENLSPEEQEKQRSTGSMINIWEHPLLADLIALPSALDVLASIGWDKPRISGGYIISKPPGSPRLFWHYDYTGYADPDAFMLPPQQIFLMWYLTDTRRENGCLRVIPRTHIYDHPLIPELREAHTDDLRRGKGLDRIEFQDQPDEVDVCVTAGDLVIGDSRLLHAAHANQSDQRRTVITLWYHPDMEALPERTQALLGRLRREPPASWSPEAWAKVVPLLAHYEGDAEPYPRSRNRPYPGPHGDA